MMMPLHLIVMDMAQQAHLLELRLKLQPLHLTQSMKKSSSFASPEILQTGTLFYVGVGVTTFLWITGKAIDVQTNRQERYAESLVHSI
ncbi:hypothetical protein BD408DRAFT_422196 [Parasitella parasitica]|nr:hypothetical protein BD408DRAFT_422196 [Parasitella parasitica]